MPARRRRPQVPVRSVGDDLGHRVLYFANITKFGPKTLAFCSQVRADFVGMVEHHMRGQDFDDMMDKFGRCGLKGFGTQGLASTRSEDGVTGGSVILARKTLGFAKLLPCVGGAAARPAAVEYQSASGNDWVFAAWKTDKVALALGAAYLDS